MITQAFHVCRATRFAHGGKNGYTVGMVEIRNSDSTVFPWALFRVTPEPEREPAPRREGGNGGWYSFLTAFLVLLLAWRWGGPLTLALASVSVGGLFLWFRSHPGGR